MSEELILQAVRGSLREGENFLTSLPDDVYATPCPEVLHASVGGHIRHLLDHFRNLLEFPPNGLLDYDRRQRQTPVEVDKAAALAEIHKLLQAVENLSPGWANVSVPLQARLQAGNPEPATVQSSVGREAIFCVMHAVHHYAIIRIICGLKGCPMPAEFGIAPSTLAARMLDPITTKSAAV